MSAVDLERLERAYDLLLPPGYRSFTLEVGAGAGVGLWTPDEILAEMRDLWDDLGGEGGTVPSPRRRIPLGQQDVAGSRRRLAEGEAEPWDQAVYPADGCIPIAHKGCQFWTALVTAGELAGTVWEVSCGVFHEEADWLPERPPSGLVWSGFRPVPPEPPAFLAWYRAWLEQVYTDLAELEATHAVGEAEGG